MKYLVTFMLLLSLAFSDAARLIANFSEGEPVYGVGTIGEKIYVIHQSNSSIHIYKSNCQLERLVNVTGMNGPYDMVISKRSLSAFIVDWFDANNTFKVLLSVNYPLTKWSFNPGTLTSVGLSITAEGNILITELQTKKLKVFTPTGTLLKTITLQNITQPRQAIKLTEHLYAVCFGYEKTEKHQVCLIDSNGATVGQCFGDKPGSSLTQLNVPARMLLLKDGSIMVADMKNQRILKLKTTNLSSPAHVIVSSSDGLSNPYRIFVEKMKFSGSHERHRLYVADNSLDPVTSYAIKGRVLVFEIET